MSDLNDGKYDGKTLGFSGLFPDDVKACSAFLRHKMFLISPRTLRENSIPFCQVCACMIYIVPYDLKFVLDM